METRHHALLIVSAFAVFVGVCSILIFVWTYVCEQKHQFSKIYTLQENPNSLGPIDVVVTWVDTNDASWQKLQKQYAPESNMKDSQNPNRWNDAIGSQTEISLCLHLIAKHMPYVRNIFLVTQRPQKPRCLSSPILVDLVTVVHHDEIYGVHADHLPTFNSNSIECHIGNIKGLSEQFVYFNDDVFVTRYIPPWKLFDQKGRAIVYGSLLWHMKLPVWCAKNDPFSCFYTNTKNILLDKRLFGRVFRHAHTFKCLNKSVFNDAVKQNWDILKGTSGSRFRQPNHICSIIYILHILLRNGDTVWCRDPNNGLKFRYLGGTETDFDPVSVDSICINSCNTRPESCKILHAKLRKLTNRLVHQVQ